MAFFNKLIASIGVGSAKVDTKVGKTFYTQGEMLEGVVEVIGGVTDQKIDSIKLKLMTLYVHEGSDRHSTAVIYTHKVNDTFAIARGEKKEIPFSFRIPLDTPITMQDPETFQNVPPVWIETEVDVKKAMDLMDKDSISIDPTEVYENIKDAIKVLGFKFRQMENCSVPSWIQSNRPFVQQFEFVPQYGRYYKKLDELEVYILQGEDKTTIYFEIDKKTSGAFATFIEKLNLDEHHGRITLKNDEIINNRSAVSDHFEEIIDSVLKKSF